tara:strand:- start:34012 stop:34395 length:384 start_codon:yes stop_codon:yes gene_type:complete
MKLTGYVTVANARVPIDWTITADGVYSSGGLESSNVKVTGVLPTTVLAAEEAALPDDGYDELTVVDLRVLLSARSEPVYGNKSDLINRLRGWDATNPDGLVAEDDGVAGGAQSLVVETDESETNDAE